MIETFAFSFCQINSLADVAIFILLSLFWMFVCFCIRKISPRKKFWLAVALIYPVLFIVGSIISHTMFTQSLLFIWWVFVPLFIGINLGHLFKTSKKNHWILIPVIVWVLIPVFMILTYSAAIFGGERPPDFYPFGEIVDEPLQDVELQVAQNVDYEIEMIHEDAWWNDSRIITIRGRNDSVFYRAVYRMCGTESNVDSSQWLPLNTEKASNVVKSLKNSIEKYEQEYYSDEVWDGYSVRVSLKDYKRKTSRRLDLSNASALGMRGAMAIEKMVFDLMPPREIFTTLSYDEVAKKCAEIENAQIQPVETGH